MILLVDTVMYMLSCCCRQADAALLMCWCCPVDVIIFMFPVDIALRYSLPMLSCQSFYWCCYFYADMFMLSCRFPIDASCRCRHVAVTLRCFLPTVHGSMLVVKPCPDLLFFFLFNRGRQSRLLVCSCLHTINKISAEQHAQTLGYFTVASDTPLLMLFDCRYRRLHLSSIFSQVWA